jgi:hypothetical protein
MAYQKYRLLQDSELEPDAKAGMTVYDIKGWDYGLANDDTRAFGAPHKSVTLDPDGGYPSFTVREDLLEPLPA